jgi:virginiamycin B lyase
VVTVDDEPGFGMFATESAVWVSSFDGATVTRFDPKTASPGVVAKVYGNPNAISVFGDTLWVAQHRGGAVTRLEEPSGSVVTEIKAGLTGRAGPQGVTATADAVWVGIPNTEAVVRIDPATNKVVATIPVTTSPCGGITATDDAVWVSSCFDDEKVIRIDPRSNQVVGEFSVGGNNGGASVVNGYPWFPVGNRLIRFNPTTNEVDGVVEFADAFQGFGSAVGFGSVWVGGIGGRSLARVPLDVLEDWATP